MQDTFAYFLVIPGGETDKIVNQTMQERATVGEAWEKLIEDFGGETVVHNDVEALIGVAFPEGTEPDSDKWAPAPTGGPYWVPTDEGLQAKLQEAPPRPGALVLAERLGVKPSNDGLRVSGGVGIQEIEQESYEGPADFMDYYPMSVEENPTQHRIIMKESSQEGTPPDCVELARSQYYLIIGQ